MLKGVGEDRLPLLHPAMRAERRFPDSEHPLWIDTEIRQEVQQRQGMVQALLSSCEDERTQPIEVCNERGGGRVRDANGTAADAPPADSDVQDYLLDSKESQLGRRRKRGTNERG